jgi:hypothetical protein
MMKKLLLAVLMAAGMTTAAFAQSTFTAKDASGSTQTFKSFSCAAGSNICSMSVPADTTGAAFGVTANPFFIAPGSGQTFPVSAASGAFASGALASGSVASGAIAAGAVSAGAFVSGSVLSGAYASGALVDVTAMQTPVAPNTATATKGLLIGGQFNTTQETLSNGQQGQVALSSRGAVMVSTGADTFNVTVNAALPAGTNLMGKVGIDQTTVGTTNGVSLAQIGTATVLAGTGAVGTGAQRVAVGTDTATIAGSAPGTAGSASSNVLSVQGIASMTPLLVNPGTAANWGIVAQASTTSGQSGQLMQGAVTTSSPSYTTAQTSPLSLDTSGNLRVNVVAGGGAGGTSSTFGAAFPGTGTAIGVKNGTNMTNLTADGSGNLNVNIAAGGGTGGTALADEGTFTAGTTQFTPVGCFFQTTATSNALTTGQGGWIQCTSQRAAFSNLRNASGTEIGTSSNEVFVGGRGTAGTAAGGVLTVQGVASMTPVQVSQATATNLNAAVTPVTAATWGIGATGAAVPANAVYLGIVSGGNLTGWNGAVTQSGSNWSSNIAQVGGSAIALGQTTMSASMPVAIASNQSTLPSNTAQVNGVTTLTGTGAVGTGAQRIAVGTDTATIAGSAPGTAGSASSNVLTVQGIASMTALLVNPGTATSWGVLTQGSTTSGQSGQLMMGAVTTSSPSYTTAQTSPFSLDTSGNLRVNVVAGAAGGTALADQATFTQSTTNETPIGCLYTSSYTTATSGKSTIASCTSAGALNVNVTNTNPNGSATSANSSPVVIASDQGAVAVKAASGAYASGSIASGAIASGALASGSIAAGAVSAGAFVSGSVLSGAYASGSLASGAVVDITNLSTPITPTTATATKGILLGMQYNSTQATFTNGQQGSVQGSSRGALFVATGADTFHVTCDSGCSSTGGTSSNFGSAFPSAGTAIGLTNGTNMVAWSATTNYGTAPSAIAVPAVNAFVTNLNANGSATSANSFPVVIASDQAAVAVKAASGAIASGAIASGAIASGAIASGAAVSGAFVAGAIADLAHGQGTMSASVPVVIASNQSAADPCMFQAKTNVAISTASGTTALVTGVSSKKIYVCSLAIVVPSAVSVSLAEGSSSSCGTSNQAAVMGVATNGTAANGLPLAANGGLTLGNGGGTVAATATATNYLCLFQSGTAQIAGNLTYVQQ